MLQEERFSCQRHKNIVNYSVFAFGKQQKDRKNPPKSVQNDLRNASWNKRLNTSSLKDFWGVGGRGATLASTYHGEASPDFRADALLSAQGGLESY